MVEEVLLRIAAEGAEVTRGKFAQALRGDLALLCKVSRPQDALDPHINRKRREPSESEQQRARRDLRADAGETLQFERGLVVAEPRDGFEAHFAACDHARGAQQVLRAVPERAGAEILLAERRKRSGLGVCEEPFAIPRRGASVAFAQRVRDLCDVRDGLLRAGDECRDTLPVRLPHETQPAARLARGEHRRIAGKCGAHLFQRMIECEIFRRDFLHAARDEQRATALLRVAWRVADHPEPAVAVPPPVEDLPAAEREPEVEFRRGDLREPARHFTK